MASARDAAGRVAFTDYARLGSQVESDGDAGIRAAARQFESLFLDMLLRQMRSAGDVLASDSPFNSEQVKFHQQMLDHQMAIDLAESGGIGLAETIARQLGAEPEGRVAPARPGFDGAALPLPLPVAIGANTMVKATAIATANASANASADATANAPATEVSTAPAAAVPPQTLRAPAPAPGGVAATSGPNLPPLDDRDLFDGTLAVAQQAPAPAGPADATGDAAADTPEGFVDRLLPVVKRVAAGVGMNPLALLAQAALETGWGRHVIRGEDGASSHNLFNIKAHRDWSGPTVETRTREFLHGRMVEQQAAFRSYPSVEAAVEDYVDFVRSSPRYQAALEVADDAAAYIEALHQGGYATDPAYVSKVLAVLDNPALRAAADPGRATP